MFTEEESGNMKTEYKNLKTHIFKMRSQHKKMTPQAIYSGVLANAESLGLTNIALLIEIMFAISPSTAHVERSFSAMNAIKTKMRSSLSPDMLNKHMWISQTDLQIDASDVLNFWIEISQQGGSAIILGKTKIPSVFKVRKGYK